MNAGLLALLLPVVVEWQLCASENRYCQEAVDSVVIVDSCPTSKTEWDDAARRKNCSSIASKQNCGPVDQFVYHCVINGYRNETLEVCAPSRIIFGRCVEFNVGGGVIQDQRSAPCTDPFPKCDAIYDSWKAYTFPDCYKLVSMGEKTSSTTVIIPTTPTTTDDALPVEYLLSIIAAVVFVFLLAVFVAVLLYCKRNQGSTKRKFEESTGDSGHVYGVDVEKTLREDESKTLINSHESDEIHQLDEMQGEQTKNHTTDLTDTGKLHQPVINNSHVSHDITPSKETGLPLH